MKFVDYLRQNEIYIGISIVLTNFVNSYTHGEFNVPVQSMKQLLNESLTLTKGSVTR